MNMISIGIIALVLATLMLAVTCDRRLAFTLSVFMLVGVFAQGQAEAPNTPPTSKAVLFNTDRSGAYEVDNPSWFGVNGPYQPSMNDQLSRNGQHEKTDMRQGR